MLLNPRGWYQRAQVRAAMGFREPTVEDEDRLAARLADEVGPVELGANPAACRGCGALRE